MGTVKFTKYTIVLFFCFLILIVVGLKSNIFAHYCDDFDKKQGSSSITQSQINDNRNSNDQLYCDISNAIIQDNYFHLQKSTESSFTGFMINSGKAEYLLEYILSSLVPIKTGYSTIPILFQKESFQS